MSHSLFNQMPFKRRFLRRYVDFCGGTPISVAVRWFPWRYVHIRNGTYIYTAALKYYRRYIHFLVFGIFDLPPSRVTFHSLLFHSDAFQALTSMAVHKLLQGYVDICSNTLFSAVVRRFQRQYVHSLLPRIGNLAFLVGPSLHFELSW